MTEHHTTLPKEYSEMLNELLTAGQDLILAAPTPTPTGDAPADGQAIINTNGIITFMVQWVAPIIVAFLGIVTLGRAQKGQVSQTLTSSLVAFLGIAFIGGAIALPLLGDDLVNLFLGS